MSSSRAKGLMESRSNKDPSCSKSVKRAGYTDPGTN